MICLNYTPGAKVTIFLEVTDGYGARANSATTPTVDRIIFPDLSLSLGLPSFFVKLDTGLYYFQFTLPTNANSIGSYFVDASFTNPKNNGVGGLSTIGYQVVCSAVYGNFSTISPTR